jgi:hypothetical protein
MQIDRKYLIVPGAILAIAAGGVGIAGATGGDDEGDQAVSGPAADRATSAALEITHGGTANSVERDSENGATWEVEVTKPDGQTVDVRLDENYGLVVVEGDSESADEDE